MNLFVNTLYILLGIGACIIVYCEVVNFKTHYWTIKVKDKVYTINKKR